MAGTLVWLRRDLRLADNPALSEAVALKEPVIPVFFWTPKEDGDAAPGAAGRWWLHQSLKALANSLADKRSALVLRQGENALDLLLQLLRETGISRIFWNSVYDPQGAARDAKIATALEAGGFLTRSFNSSLLFTPGTVLNGAGSPYLVFTPFWKKCLSIAEPDEPTPVPRVIPPPSVFPCSETLASFGLEPKKHWTTGLNANWTPGESGGLGRFRSFLKNGVEDYSNTRNRPDLSGVSRLSPHLHFGEISPRLLWHDVREKARHGSAFVRQLGWREFSSHLLHFHPHTVQSPLREEFRHLKWRRDQRGLRAWQKGLTGYPLVDAGMRQLWMTGWMHNRVRMMVASFLVKDLLIDWREGAAWFNDTLVDADLANNTMGWQWVAGCGADAAPYYRVFNPVLQGEKFDPDGNYVRKFVPELASLPKRWIHKPWLAPEVMRAGITYPAPVVSHSEARLDALEAFAEMRRKAKTKKPASKDFEGG